MSDLTRPDADSESQRYRYADYLAWYRQWQETLDPAQFFDQVFGAKPVMDQ